MRKILSAALALGVVLGVAACVNGDAGSADRPSRTSFAERATGAWVRTPTGAKIGSVHSVVVRGGVETAIVAVGAYFSPGFRLVALPVAELSLSGGEVVLAAGEGRLAPLPIEPPVAAAAVRSVAQAPR